MAVLSYNWALNDLGSASFLEERWRERLALKDDKPVHNLHCRGDLKLRNRPVGQGTIVIGIMVLEEGIETS